MPREYNGESIVEDGNVLKRSYVYAILLPLTFLFGLATGYLVWGKGVNEVPTVETPAVAEGPNPVTTEEPEIVRYDVPADDDPYLGPEDAPITII